VPSKILEGSGISLHERKEQEQGKKNRPEKKMRHEEGKRDRGPRNKTSKTRKAVPRNWWWFAIKRGREVTEGSGGNKTGKMAFLYERLEEGGEKTEGKRKSLLEGMNGANAAGGR